MNHPIICFEGPSGIGKTTMCKMLSNEFNIVPEVNLLFERPKEESRYWYLERQVERYEMCRRSSISSILDGDIFQPIWYNWVCNYPSKFLPKDETHSFYKAKLLENKIAFPDLYIIFHVEEKELWNRKENDTTRRRRNFEKHLKIIEPLKEYYRFLDQETDVEMRFVHYTNMENAKREVLTYVEAFKNNTIDRPKAFDQIENWINKKSNFK